MAGVPRRIQLNNKGAETLHQEIAETVESGSKIHTDKHGAYRDRGLAGYIHSHVKHGSGEYVGAGNVTKNSVESMWTLFKRSVYGIWHHVSVGLRGGLRTWTMVR